MWTKKLLAFRSHQLNADVL